MFALIDAAGWPIYPLLLASIIALAIIGERLWSLREAVVMPKNLLAQVITEYRQNGLTPQLFSRLTAELPACPFAVDECRAPRRSRTADPPAQLLE